MQKNRIFLGLGIVSLTLVGLLSRSAFAAGSDSASANATITILQDLTLTKDRDLAFADAYRGDAAATVLPADAESAQFSVSGAPSAQYTITLPTDGTVTMITGGGGANETIGVNSFAHNAGGTPALDVSGADQFEVGATRDAIGASQVFGAYSASFNVSVAYQ